ncbi:MAG: hypothetical protein Q7R41_20720 [Phycisphaerales bacterium]|nr:hypothetical protein [Phycisphaerales bacterium]
MTTDSVVSALLQNWANIATVLCGFAALVAIVVALRSNKIAKNSNAIAAKALQLQEDGGKVKLIVKPHMYFTMSGADNQTDRNALAGVEVINLSAFPVTVTKILWKTTRTGEPWMYWKYPKFFSPFRDLPIRLPPREAFVAYVESNSLRPEELASITGAGVGTACGEIIEGTTDDWKQAVAKIVSESNAAQGRT